MVYCFGLGVSLDHKTLGSILVQGLNTDRCGGYSRVPAGKDRNLCDLLMQACDATISDRFLEGYQGSRGVDTRRDMAGYGSDIR